MNLYQINSNGSAVKSWAMHDNALIAGRDEGASARIPDWRMSNKHFIIFRDGGALHIHDLHSKHGTWVNGRRVTNLHRMT